MWVDKTINKIITETEEKFKDKGVSREQIKEAFYLYWLIVASFMKDVRFPRIHIPKFGYLEPRITFIKNRLASFRSNPKWGDEGKFYGDEAEKALDRIRKEHKNRKRK